MSLSSSSKLNPKQLEAVKATEGPVLVLAGAGSGKTRVLTERIAHLINAKKVSPHNILAFTFTNKAAQEMKERLEGTIPGVSSVLWVGTFHSTGVKILRRHGNLLGIPGNFSIYDAADSLNLVKSVISHLTLEGTILKSANSIRDSISRWKSDLITPQLALERAASNLDKKMVQIYTGYEEELRRSRALDFDDLISKVVELFAAHKHVREEYARRFLYVLVDEFQDTNPIQMVMIDALSSWRRNLFVVGDDDQSIYSWRGAKVEHILNFESLYPGTRIIRLEQNYRSTRTILEAANHVVAFNKGRKGKNLWTDGDLGEKVKVLVSMDEEAEALNVLGEVKELQRKQYPLRCIAVLYRTNAQSRSLEEIFKMGGIPYQIIGSVRFYERVEVRDILGYCKLLVNPADALSLKRIINVPKRGLGKTTFQALEEQGRQRGISVLELLTTGEYDLGAAQKRRCKNFVNVYEKLRDLYRKDAAPGVIEAIIDRIDYRRYLRDSYPDSEARIENIEELVSAADVFSEMNEDRSLGAFLQEIALVSDIDAIDEQSGLLTLMTLHNAKGLEFDCIIITGMEDGLFPHYSSLERESELEEERRLFYVGMTRARKLLYLSYANMRRRMGVVAGQAPSRFLFEMPEECIEGQIESPLADTNMGYANGSFSRTIRRWNAKDHYSLEHPDYENISQEEIVYRVGTRVVHEKFGKGIVRKVEGSGQDLRVTIIFDSGSQRKFIASFAPMRPI